MRTRAEQSAVLALTEMPVRRAGDGDDLLTASEVASILRVTPDWVYAQTRNRRIPHLRLGRYVRYRRRALIDWMEAMEVSPPSVSQSVWFGR